MKTFGIKNSACICALGLAWFGFSRFTNPSETEIVSGNIDTLVSQNLIDVTLTAKGGHQGDCIEIEARNKTDKDIKLYIEAGRRFVSSDSTEQDIFVVRDRFVTIKKREKTTFTVFGFCCESSMHSPKKGGDFSKGYVAPKTWVEVAKFINRYPQLDNSTIQTSVWCMSNNHSISGINESAGLTNKMLKRLLAKVKKEELPWYTSEYQAPGEGEVFSNKVKRIYGEIPFYTKSDAEITVKVMGPKNQLMKTLLEEAPFGPGKHIFDMQLDVTGWPKQPYAVYFYADGMFLMKQDFRI